MGRAGGGNSHFTSRDEGGRDDGNRNRHRHSADSTRWPMARLDARDQIGWRDWRDWKMGCRDWPGWDGRGNGTLLNWEPV